jgi:hypothetical protein
VFDLLTLSDRRDDPETLVDELVFSTPEDEQPDVWDAYSRGKQAANNLKTIVL